MSGVLAMMLGLAGSMYKFNLTGGLIADEVASPTDLDVVLFLNNDGRVLALTSTGTVQINAGTDWIIPNQFAPAGSTPLSMGMSARATLQSGTAPSGSALDSWLDLATDRSWSLTQSGAGSKTCTLLVEIRGEPGGAVFATGTYTLSASVI